MLTHSTWRSWLETCRGSLWVVDGSIPNPPNNIVVARLEKRPFRDQSGALKTPSRASAAHYHARLGCVCVLVILVLFQVLCSFPLTYLPLSIKSYYWWSLVCKFAHPVNVICWQTHNSYSYSMLNLSCELALSITIVHVLPVKSSKSMCWFTVQSRVQTRARFCSVPPRCTS